MGEVSTCGAALLVVLAASLGGCAQGREPMAPEAQALLCPELGANSDPLEARYSDQPAANARIRAFVASARSLNDVTIEIERRAIDTCRRIAKDIGAAEVPPGSALDVQCASVRAAIASLIKDGIELRIAIVPPRCAVDAGRKARCDAAASAAGQASEADGMCEAQAAVYSRCTLPAIAVAISRKNDTAAKLAQSLEENFPAMLYADMALGRRVVDHVSKITVASAKLTTELADVGPHGFACIGLATSVAAKSSSRLNAFLSLSAALILDLDPEMVPTPPKGAT